MATETYRIALKTVVEDETGPGFESASRKVSAFDKTIEKTQSHLKRLTGSRWDATIDLKDKATRVLSAVESRIKHMAGNVWNFTVGVIDKASAPLRGIFNILNSVQGAILGATGAFAGIIKPMGLAGDYEQTAVAFDTLLGSAEKATAFLKEAQQFANTTPFEFPELLDSSKLLLSFGFEADKVLGMMETIGDTSSGLGAGADGIDRITRAMGQMYAKGRVQAEELLQLQEMGVPAAQILQEELGLTAGQVANIGHESVSASTAIQALMIGMEKRFGGMMTNQSKTAKGMISTISDTLQNNLLRNWGTGLWDGIKPGLEKITTWLDENQDTVARWGEAWREAGTNISTWVMKKVDGLRQTVSDLVNSQEWKEAGGFGEKISLAWDKIVAEPFSQWWESSGKPWLTEKVAAFGETLGSGITAGLLAILGFDESGAIADGMTIGKSFLDGFKSGLDMDKISEAFTEWAGDHKGVIAAAGLVAGGKLLGGAAKAFQAAKGLFGGTSGGGGGGGLGSFVSTMTVSAGTVIVNGGMASNAANAVRTAAGGGGLPPLAGGTPALPGAAGGGRLALPGPAGGTAAAGGLTSAGSWLSKLLTAGSKSSVVGADGTLLAVQGGIGGTLGSVGGALGSQATTAAGAAAAGGGAIAGGVMGGVGIISGLIDIFKGTQTSGKEAQDRYATGGTKIGMVGAGAAAGAAIGSVVPVVGTGIGALVGAGVGGVGAMLGGSKIGKMLSDSLDEGGLLNNAGKAIGGFFTETLPNFVTKSIPAAISSAGEAIGGFASSVGEIVGGFFTETIPTFLTEQVPYAVGYVVGAAQVFFTETVPGAVGDMLQTVGTFFTETVPAWAEGVAQRATTFFTETVPAAVGGLLQNVGNFFTETLPAWAEGVGQRAAVFFGETVPTFVGELFTNVGTFFTETIPEWATGAFEAAATFFTEDVPRFIGDLWDNVTGFVTETIPAWGKSIGDKVSGWWDSISGWFSDLWDGISGAFSSGKSAGAEAAGGKHAEGGIMHAPHMAQVAEDGPEAIIPLGASSRSRGMAVWEQAGDILGANAPAPVGSNDNGLGDIIPEGNRGAWSAPQDGESGNDAPVYTTATPGTTGPAGGQGEPTVTVPVNITINPEIVIQAAAQGMSQEDIVALLKEHIRAMVDDISDEMAEKLARIFANMPVRGGA